MQIGLPLFEVNTISQSPGKGLAFLFECQGADAGLTGEVFAG